MAGLFIRGATVIAMGNDPAHHLAATDMRIEGDRLVAIGDTAAEPGDVVLDAHGLVATPGFVQTHVHLCQTLFRGLADDLALLPWLRDRIWPLEAAHDPESTESSAELALCELVRGGTTTLQGMESVRHTEAAFEVAQRIGVTAVLGNCLMDVRGDGVPDDLPTSAAEALRHADALRVAYDGVGRLHYAVSPRFVLSCTDELARDAAAFADDHHLRIHTHAGEHPDEVAAVRRRFDRDYVEVLGDQGLLGPRTGLAHCVHTSDAERAAMIDADVAVLHCPTTNLKLGSGVAPVADYRDAGLRVGLGADGAPCNNRLSALTELRQAALLQAMRAGPGRLSAAQALRMATLGGAEALGLAHDIGSLEAGKRADVLLFDLEPLAPGGDPISRLVYAASETHLRHVVLGGALVVRNGEHQLLDAPRIRARGDAALRALLARAAL